MANAAVGGVGTRGGSLRKRNSGPVSARSRWAHDPREARKVRRAANKAYQLPRRPSLLNGEEEWRARRKKWCPEGPRTGKLISFNLAGDQRPPTGFTSAASHIDFRASRRHLA